MDQEIRLHAGVPQRRQHHRRPAIDHGVGVEVGGAVGVAVHVTAVAGRETTPTFDPSVSAAFMAVM